MKTQLTTLLFIFGLYGFGQKSRVEDSIGKVTNVYIDNDLSFMSSANDNRSEAKAGVSKLGIKFTSGFFYGHASFNIFSQNNEINTSDINEKKLFGSSLLIPENSSNNISNFSISLGTKSFYKFESVRPNNDLFSLKRFGFFASFSVNNTNWVKDTIRSTITINTANIYVTYSLIDLDLNNEKAGENKISLLILAGYTGRRLGGDYGLNKQIQKDFLNTNKLGFDGAYIGCRLEIGKFYGQMNLTSFKRGDNILGFSGNQAIINIGVLADLKLASKINNSEQKKSNGTE